jgi:hypothetical protein
LCFLLHSTKKLRHHPVIRTSRPGPDPTDAGHVLTRRHMPATC